MKLENYQLYFERDLEIVEKYHPGYKENLLNLAREDVNLATKKLREDFGYPILDCKKQIWRILNDF